MPTAGLSLAGFMDQAAAFNHLRTACIPADGSDAALQIVWDAARAARGPAVANAGKPQIIDLPASYLAYQKSLLALPNVQAAMQGVLLGSEVKLVEIKPLLAFQFAVDTERATHHARNYSGAPTTDELLAACLPLNQQQENFEYFRGTDSILVKGYGMNLVPFDQGLILQNQVLGMHFGPSMPFVQVVRHNNHAYLHNGFHRAYGAGRAGATHIPALVRDVPTHEAAGIRTDGNTFSANVLESADPPTLSHFIEGRAINVQLRKIVRMLHVSWASYAVNLE